MVVVVSMGGVEERPTAWVPRAQRGMQMAPLEVASNAHSYSCIQNDYFGRDEAGGRLCDGCCRRRIPADPVLVIHWLHVTSPPSPREIMLRAYCS
jgi:hypothetical protein